MTLLSEHTPSSGRVAPRSPLRAAGAVQTGLAALAARAVETATRDLGALRIAIAVADAGARLVVCRVADRDLRTKLDADGYVAGATSSASALRTAIDRATPIVLRGTDPGGGQPAGPTTAAAPIFDVRTGRVLGAVALVCAPEDTSALLLPYARRLAREIESEIEGGSVAERALLEHFIRSRRRMRTPFVSISRRNLFANAAAAHLLDPSDHARLWANAECCVVEGRETTAELMLGGGRRVSARSAPVWFGNEIVGALVHLAVATSTPQTSVPGSLAKRSSLGWSSLSDAQMGIAELVAAGLTNREIAARLYLSPHTVDFHLRQIFRKLDINSRVDLARRIAELHGDRVYTREAIA
jgi:DNA-binding CsgD family transcriptional regulator